LRFQSATRHRQNPANYIVKSMNKQNFAVYSPGRRGEYENGAFLSPYGPLSGTVVKVPHISEGLVAESRIWVAR
jgi:hypothetical protein